MTTSENTSQIVAKLGAIRIVPVTSFDHPDQVEPTAVALVKGGVSCIEVTFRTAAAAEAISRARQIDGLVVGAGTILSVHQVRDAINAGAHFGVAPGTNPDVVAAAQAAGWPFFPGVATASEIDRARSLGITTLKAFPAAVIGGVSFLKAVAAVYPDVRFIPTGGIDTRNVGDYAVLDNVLAVGGSWLTPLALIRQGNHDEIERLAREARKQVS